MMFSLFLFILFIILIYIINNKEYTFFVSLVLLFPAIISLVLHGVGLDKKEIRTAVLLVIYLFLLIQKQPLNRYLCKKYYHNPVTIAIICFLVVVFITDFFVSPYYGFYLSQMTTSEFKIVTNVCLPYLILPLFIKSEQDLCSFSNSIVVWTFVVFLGFFAVYGFSPRILFDRIAIGELSDGALDSITLSRYAAMSVLVSFFLIFKENENDSSHSKRHHCVSIIMLIMSCLALFITGQRGSIIGVVLGLLMMAVRKEWRKHIILILPFMVAVVALSFLLELEVASRFSELQNVRNFERFYDFYRVFHIFENNDYLWGLGTDGYHYITGFRPYPHNIILQHISDYGLFGLLCITIILYYGIKYAYYIVRFSNKSYYLFFASAWAASMFSALVSSGINAHREPYLLTGVLLLIYFDMQYELLYPHRDDTFNE